jgi:hypothetical protein
MAREMPVDAMPQPATPAVPWKWLSIAAAVVIALGIGWQLAPWRQADPVYRSVETRTIASALPPGAVLSRTEPVLRWTGVDGARYRVRVLAPDLQVLEESMELSTPEYTISRQALDRLGPDSQILWQVEGRVPGDAVVVSPTFSIRVP